MNLVRQFEVANSTIEQVQNLCFNYYIKNKDNFETIKQLEFSLFEYLRDEWYKWDNGMYTLSRVHYNLREQRVKRGEHNAEYEPQKVKKFDVLSNIIFIHERISLEEVQEDLLVAGFTLNLEEVFSLLQNHIKRLRNSWYKGRVPKLYSENYYLYSPLRPKK